MSDLEQRIKEAAEKATQGEWQMYGGNYSFAVHPKGVRDVVIACDVHLSEPQWKGRDAEIFPKTGVIKMEDAIYIALVSPSNIKALLAEKDAEIAQLKWAARINSDEWKQYVESLKACAEQLEGTLRAIDRLCSEEIAIRFGNHAHKSEDELGRNSRVYALLVVPRNIARAALKAYDSLSGPREGEQDAGNS